MNYSIHPQIREALKHAESVNVRGEVSIPLYRLKEELEKRRIERQDFKDYLFVTYHNQTKPTSKKFCLVYFQTPPLSL